MRALGVVLAVVSLAAASSGAGAAPATDGRLVIAASDAPTASGDVYRVTLAGRRTNLTHSPFSDRQPVASQDGSTIAFLSDRDGSNQIWSVRADGTRLTRLSRGIPDVNQVTPIAWSPDGRRFLASGGGVSGAALWVLQAGRPQRRISGFWTNGGVAYAAWSPDGDAVAYAAFGLLHVTTPSGREEYVAGDLPGVDWLAWSRLGPLAVHAGTTGEMLDRRGRSLARFESKGLAWSPDGKLLASVVGGLLEVRDAAGKLVLSKRIFAASLVHRFATEAIGYNPQLLWAGSGRVLVGNVFLRDQCGGQPGVPCPYGKPNVAVSVPSGMTSKPSQRAWFAGACGCRSPDGRLLARVVGTTRFSLRVSRAAGGGVRTIAAVPGCWSDGVWSASAQSPRFAGPGAVVYASACAPPANLWLANADGSGLRRVTNGRANQTQPAWAPDGSAFAYVQAFATGCQGCSESIWVRNADGSSPRRLTTPPADDGWFDERPTFSPDGRTILFSRGSLEAEKTDLFTVSAAGGTPEDLGVAGSEPAWGPSRIAYVGPQGGVFTAAADGSGATRVLARGGDPSWSRDGKLAVLQENPDGTRFTAVVLAGGTTTRAALPFRRVTALSWTADGTRLLVVGRKGAAGPSAVWSVKPDGAGATRLTASVDAQGASGG